MGQSVDASATADLNLDGQPDLATLSTESGSVRVALRDLDNPRNFRLLAAFPVGPEPTGLAIANFDLPDPVDDLAISIGGADEVGVFFGTLNGDDVSYTERPEVRLAAGMRPSAVATGDLDFSGTADIVVANQDEDTVILYFGAEPSCDPIPVPTRATTPAVSAIRRARWRWPLSMPMPYRISSSPTK